MIQKLAPVPDTHSDHRRWMSDIAMWQDDIDQWRVQHAKALAPRSRRQNSRRFSRRIATNQTEWREK
jgi:hypothetical protein